MNRRNVALLLVCIPMLFVFCLRQAVRAEDSARVGETVVPQTDSADQRTDASDSSANSSPADAPIAVLPFRLAEDDSAQDSDAAKESRTDARIAARLTGALAAAGRFTVVERAELDRVLNEIALSQSGAVSDADLLEVGRLAGAQFIVLGELGRENAGESEQTDSDRYSASYRVIKSETGVVIAAGAASGSYNQISAQISEQLRDKLGVYLLLNNPDSPYSILLQTDRGKDAEYTVGETIEITFKVEKHRDSAPDTVYVTLYAIDARGRMTMIYPNKFTPQSAVQIGQAVRLPDPSDDYVWRLAPPAGAESVQAIVTEREVDFFQMRGRHRTEAFPTVPGASDNRRTFSAIVTELKEEKLGDWAAERITYRLRPEN